MLKNQVRLVKWRAYAAYVRTARHWKTQASAVTMRRLYSNSLTSVKSKARYVELTTDLLMMSCCEHRWRKT